MFVCNAIFADGAVTRWVRLDREESVGRSGNVRFVTSSEQELPAPRFVEKGHFPTRAPQQTTPLFDYLVGAKASL
jgi:hypothetical protein